MVTSQAQAVPVTSVRLPTPAISSTVSSSDCGRTVRARCGQMFSAGASASARMVAIGTSMTATMAPTISVQPGDERRRPRHACTRSGSEVRERSTSWRCGPSR